MRCLGNMTHLQIFACFGVLYAVMHAQEDMGGVVCSCIRYGGTRCFVALTTVEMLTADLGFAQLATTCGHSVWVCYAAIAVLLGERTGNAYRCMLISSAAFAIYDTPLSVYRMVPDLLYTVIHHAVVAVVSLLLLQEPSAILGFCSCSRTRTFAAICFLSELSTVLYCVREMLKTSSYGWNPVWLSKLFHATHFLIRGPVILLAFAWLGPEYLATLSDSCKLVMVACGAAFVALNSMWNLAILRKYVACLKPAANGR